jgi:hypothetical protein
VYSSYLSWKREHLVHGLADVPHERVLQGLDLVSELLAIQCDDVSLWNMRKRLLSESASVELLQAELQLTQTCLQTNPKSYGSWYHRLWTVKLLPAEKMDWQKELGLLTKLLALDARNCARSSIFFIFLTLSPSPCMGVSQEARRIQDGLDVGTRRLGLYDAEDQPKFFKPLRLAQKVRFAATHTGRCT